MLRILMRYFPICLDLKDKSCLLVGAGQVGRRKLQRLLQAGPRSILVLDPALQPGMLPEAGPETELILENRPYQPQDLQGMFLVLACTTDPGLNKQISAQCRERNILCNSANQPEESGFIIPALHTAGDLQITVSTTGKSPALAASIKNRLAEEYGPEYGFWLQILGRIRLRVQEQGWPHRENAALFRSLLDPELLQALRNKDKGELQDILRRKLPTQLMPCLGEFTHGIFSDI